MEEQLNELVQSIASLKVTRSKLINYLSQEESATIASASASVISPLVSNMPGTSLLATSNKIMKVAYDFNATPDSEEISVFAGQEVTILEPEDGGWCWVLAKFQDGQTREGFVPYNYLED